jgi:hypothetical protein
MLSFQLIAFILISHYVADFLFQTNDMAQNKSKSIYWLSVHICVYTAVLFVLLNPYLGVMYFVINGTLHFIIDFITSKITAQLWKNGNVGMFFNVIGLDQLLHTLCLIYTAQYFI